MGINVVVETKLRLTSSQESIRIHDPSRAHALKMSDVRTLRRHSSSLSGSSSPFVGLSKTGEDGIGW